MIPISFVGLSGLVLFAHAVSSSCPYRSLCIKVFGIHESDHEDSTEYRTTSTTTTSNFFGLNKNITHHGGVVIFSYRILQFSGCLSLLGLSALTALKDELYPSKGFSDIVPALAMCIFYVCTFKSLLHLCLTVTFSSIYPLLELLASQPDLSGVEEL